MTTTRDRNAWTLHTDWRDEGNCRDEDPELFFPITRVTSGDEDDLIVETEPPYPVPRAKAICERCTVAADCLAYALQNGVPFGTFGGMSAYQRELISKPMKRKRCPGCASTELINEGKHEICGSCGVSWDVGLLD